MSKKKARRLLRASGPRDALLWVELLNLQEDDGEGVEGHRLDQHERQNQGETYCGGCAWVAGESFASCGGCFRLGVTAGGRGNGHGKAGRDRDPVCGRASSTACLLRE